MEAAIEAGADDVITDEDGHTIICSFESIGEVSKALEATLGEAQTVKPVWKPQNTLFRWTKKRLIADEAHRQPGRR